MKKTLVALAVMAAAGVASAQSSVTLFGIADVGLTYGHGSTNNELALTSGNLSPSRIGFRGVEDLGGGLSASFWLESGFNLDTGEGQATGTNNQPLPAATPTPPTPAGTQGLTFNRRSTVSLGGGFGEVRLGRDYVPSYWNLSVFDPFGAVGVGTSVIPQVRGGTLANIRASNSIGYFLPKNLGGFYGQAMYAFGENPRGTATKNDGNYYGLRVGYATGPLDVALGYGHQEAALAPSAGDRNDVNLGASYDFGIAKLMAVASRQTRKFTTGDVDYNGFLLGGTMALGPGEFRAAFSQVTTDNPVGADPRARKFALGYVYNLSKRTALYSSLAFVKNSKGSNVSLGGSVTGANDNSTGLDLGVRHAF